MDKPTIIIGDFNSLLSILEQVDKKLVMLDEI